jgi:hypothetical protein
MQTLTNSFHNTSIRIRSTLTVGQIFDAAWQAECHRPCNQSKADKLAIALRKRIWSKLCGIKGCTCGTVR